MNLTSPNGGVGHPLAIPLRFKDFSVTWAGAAPAQVGGFCFGSEDGRLLFTNEEGNIIAGPGQGSQLDEAINGVAYAGRRIAVSTRAGIVFGNLPGKSVSQGENLVFPYGAHGVERTASGYFVAPLGPAGVLIVKADAGVDEPVASLRLDKEQISFYRVRPLQVARDKEVLLCACRQGGVGIVDMQIGQQAFAMRFSAVPGLDVVDCCEIGLDTAVPALAAISRDGLLVVVRDALYDEGPKTMRFRAVKGTTYRVLSARGHLLVLTSRGLYILTRLAERLVAGLSTERFATQIFTVPLTDCVDMGVVGRWLLLVTAEEVLKFDLALIEKTVPTEASQKAGNVEEETAAASVLDWVVTEMTQTPRELVGTRS